MRIKLLTVLSLFFYASFVSLNDVFALKRA